MLGKGHFPLVLFLVGTITACPNGSVAIPYDDGNKCIKLFTKASFYWNAVKECMNWGGDVAIVANSLENTALFALQQQGFSNIPAFIGYERTPNGSWVYANGIPPKFVNLLSGQPASNDECTVLDSGDGKWRKADCQVRRPFFCSINQRSCDDNWSYFNGYCYYVSPQSGSYTFTTAESLCQSVGPDVHLVSVHSKAEDTFLKELISMDGPVSSCAAAYVWTGLYGNGKYGSGTWTDGTPVDYAIFTTTNTYMYNWNVAADVGCGYLGWNYSPSNAYRHACKRPAK